MNAKKQTRATGIDMTPVTDMSSGAVCARLTEAVEKKIIFLHEAIRQAYNAGYYEKDREVTA